MKTYSVHTLPWSAASDGDVIVIAERFNWAALLFGPFWALWHGMWKTALALLALGAALGGAGALAGLTPDAITVLQGVVQIGLGLWANDLRRWVVARTGYVERAVVAGHDASEAEYRYFTTVMGDAIGGAR